MTQLKSWVKRVRLNLGDVLDPSQQESKLAEINCLPVPDSPTAPTLLLSHRAPKVVTRGRDMDGLGIIPALALTTVAAFRKPLRGSAAWKSDWL